MFKSNTVNFERLIKEKNVSISSNRIDKTYIKNEANKDVKNIVFLMFLYLLQGIPLGLIASLPFILSSRNVSYYEQAVFSLASWPFAMKLLWAPIVDSLYIKRIGRRKSWLVPVQYLIGIFMVLFSDFVHQILEIDRVYSPNGISTRNSILLILKKFYLNSKRYLHLDGHIFYVYIPSCNSRHCCRWLRAYHSFKVILNLFDNEFCSSKVKFCFKFRENSHWASICNNAG